MSKMQTITTNAGAISTLWLLLSVINRAGSEPGPIDKAAITIAFVSAILFVVGRIIEGFIETKGD